MWNSLPPAYIPASYDLDIFKFRSIDIFLNIIIHHLTILLLNVYCIFIIFLCLLYFFNLLPHVCKLHSFAFGDL